MTLPKLQNLRLTIVCSRYYPEITDMLISGVHEHVKSCGMPIQNLGLFEIGGALEIPSAIARLATGSQHADGFLALGCVVRGETAHYNIVANQSAWGLQWLALNKGYAIGNGILTVDNLDQARVRADPGQTNNKGKQASAALISLLMLPS